MVKIGKLKVCINPEIVSQASKIKKLEVYAVWLALRTIDINKKGSGKISLSTCLDIIHEITKCNKNYSYALFKKGINIFWGEPSGVKGSKIIYLQGMNKVIENLSFELAKTRPFIIKMEELFKHENISELKTFLCDFVISRYGSDKPITIKSLESNLGLSNSTVKRRIRSSYNLNKTKNFCFLENEFSSLFDAKEYLNKVRLIMKSNGLSYKIIKKNNKFSIAKQIGNSYTCNDYSRGRIATRPRSFKKIDSDNKETFETKKYYYTKVKNVSEKSSIMIKIKDQKESYNSWKIVNPDYDMIKEINEKVNMNSKSRFWASRKKWNKIKKECA